LNYDTFKEEIKNYLIENCDEGAEVNFQTVTKNNNIKLEGVTIRENGINLCPTIYLNSFYQDFLAGNITLAEVQQEIINLHREKKVSQNFDLERFENFEMVKSHVAFRIINFRLNQELLKSIPHIPYLDLAIVFYCILDDFADGTASIIIRNEHLSMWEITDHDLYEIALKNTRSLLPEAYLDMANVVDHLLSDKQIIFEDSLAIHDNLYKGCMYILSNKKNLFGAASILYNNLLKDLSDKLMCSFIILPSSVHEVILVPAKTKERLKDFNEMVQAVNSEEVSPDEILSDHAYYYDRSEQALFMS